MDFFQQQDYARRQSRRLVVLFVLSVVAIILTLYLLAALAMGETTAEPGIHAERPPQAATIWYPELFLAVAGGTLLVISLGSIYKIAELSAGGQKVALLLGGRQIPPQTTDLAERRLLNVVEEMSLASGVPVPPVYVLDHEPGINAFAAGHQPADAVVAVSRGCLAYLTREELQGVVGHEFSHILNGDMRLNLRLIGIVHGILILAILGYYLLRASQFSGGDSRKKDGAAAMALAGLALVVLGYLGVFFGNLIKSAISRQREYLADASAVQFTRYPGGIAGALKKIGGLAEGSRINDGHAQEISHMFFANALTAAWINLLATHPPLVDRIRQIEPDFDGRFPSVSPLRAFPEPVSPARPTATAAIAGFDSSAAMAKVGQPGVEEIHRAESILTGVPTTVIALARDPYTARVLIWSLLLDRQDAAVRLRQQTVLAQGLDPKLSGILSAISPAVDGLDPAVRLPLVDLAAPALKGLSPAQYAVFRDSVEQLCRADERLDLFEYCLRCVLFSYLDVHFGLARVPKIRYDGLSALQRPLALVLSALARVGAKDESAAGLAFHAATRGLLEGASLLPAEACSLAAFDRTLRELAQAAPLVKKKILAACSACIAADRRAEVTERELLRAIAAVLACPMPPLAVGGDQPPGEPNSSV